MKIGIVCYPTFGGSGVLATELGISLSKRGHQVHFISYQKPARLSTFHRNVFYHEVSAMDYPLFEFTPYESALTSKMVDVALYEDLDIFHVHYALPHASVAYLAREIIEAKKGRYIPIITTLHGTDITIVGNDPSYSPVVEFSMNRSDGLTAVSEFLKKETEKIFDMDREIKVIHNFIDFDRFQSTEKEDFKSQIAPEGDFILTHMSNFRKVKRVSDVIKVFDKVQQEVDSTLLLIGDGPERQQLETLCREIGICHKVKFLGKQDAIEDIIGVSDLFLLPSENESFGLAGLEAMASGVPVISTNVEGLPEVNIHDKTGYLCEVGDVNSMAEYALSLLQDEVKLNKFKRQAREWSERFDIKEIVPLYEDFYKKIYENKSN